MPIYEYRCQSCGQITPQFVRHPEHARAPACEHCGHARTTRALSRFATLRTEQQVMEQYGMPEAGAGPDAYKDPRQIGRWVEQRFDQLGMDLPDEARTMIDAARSGDLPDPVKDL